MKHHVCIFLLLLSMLPLAQAKRAAPKPVPPVTRNGVVYSAPNDNGRIGYVVASNAKDGAKLYDLTIYETRIDPHLEEDVQEVFITDLRFEGYLLAIKDEKGRCYKANLVTRDVAKVKCH